MERTKKIVAGVLLVLFVMWNMPVHAVLQEKKILVTDSKGEPVPNTEVTILNKEGEEIGKGETDDEGMLIVNVPEGEKIILK